MERCEACGFVYDLDLAETAGERIRHGAQTMADLVGAARAPEVHGDETTWSALEYLCHVRDVLLVQRERVLRARREDVPSFEPMGRDERVEHDGYGEQVPAEVARQTVDAAAMFANVLARLGPDDWERGLTYHYPVRMERSLRWVAVHTVHEVEHHLADARDQLPPTT